MKQQTLFVIFFTRLSNPSVFVQLLILSVYLLIVFGRSLCGLSPGTGNLLAPAGALPHWIHSLMDLDLPIHWGQSWHLFYGQVKPGNAPRSPSTAQTFGWEGNSLIPSTFNTLFYKIKQSQAVLITKIDLMSYLHSASEDGPECRRGRLQEPLPWFSTAAVT